MGERSHVRTSIPVSVNKDVLQQINNVLNVNMRSQTTQTDSQSDKLSSQRNLFTSHVNYTFTNTVSLIHSDSRQHVLVIAQLARDFGLRFREASLLDAKQALKEAPQYNRINITEGTKGGRGKEKDRWVPVNRENLQTFQQVVQMQGQNRNLIPAEMSYIQWRNHAYSQWRQIAKPFGIKGFHELRAAYACERYQQLTGHPAPMMTGGQRTAPKFADQQARDILAQQLGHGRTDVIAQYIGSAR